MVLWSYGPVVLWSCGQKCSDICSVINRYTRSFLDYSNYRVVIDFVNPIVSIGRDSFSVIPAAEVRQVSP